MTNPLTGRTIEQLLELVMAHAEIDLKAAHAEICKLQGVDPKTHDWPEWSTPANTIRWFADIRATLAARSPAPIGISEREADEKLLSQYAPADAQPAQVGESDKQIVLSLIDFLSNRLMTADELTLLRKSKELLSRLSAPAGDGWRTMESAPKNGSEIEAKYEVDAPDEDADIIYWSDTRYCMIGSPQGSCGPGWMSREAGLPIENPAVWRVIPAKVSIAINDRAVRAALKAWFSGSQSETDSALAKSMKRAIEAALPYLSPSPGDRP